MTLEPRAIQNFRANLDSVRQLMQFDDLVLEVIAAPARALRERLAKHEIDNPHLQPDRIIQTIDSIRQNSSLRPYYEAMHNQCLVLAVSYFGAATRELFVDAVAEAIRRGSPTLMKEHVQITVQDLVESEIDRAQLAAEFIADGPDSSWQDMKSIGRAYSRIFAAAPERGETVNDIIAAQAFRHAVVHSGGIVDRRLVGQVKNAFPRSLFRTVSLDAHIRVVPDEVTLAGDQMLRYLHELHVIVQRVAI